MFCSYYHSKPNGDIFYIGIGNKNPNYGNGEKIKGGKHPLAIKVKYNEMIFSCIKDLSTYLNMAYKTIHKRVKTNAAKYGYEVLK